MLFLVRLNSIATAFFTVTEITAFSNNTVWYAQRLGASPKAVFRWSLFRYISFFNKRLVTFAVVRLPIAPYTVWYVLTHVGGYDEMVKELAKRPIWSFQVCFMVVLFGFLNILWTGAMLASSLKLWKRWRKSETVKEKTG